MKLKYLAAFMALGISFTGCDFASINESSTENIATEKVEESENVQEIEQAEVSDVSDSIRWMNATYGIVTNLNGGDLNLVGGFTQDDITSVLSLKKGLKEWWDISTREEADDTITWLIDEGGHNANLLEEYNKYGLGDYSREELVASVSDLDEANQIYLLGIYDAVQDYGENAILAWDLSRAMQLLGWYYVTGMYTYEETMDKTYEIAQKLQTTYTSWDDMMGSYFYGFQYWNEDNPQDTASDSYNRKQIYEALKMEKNSPYNLPWDLQLQKE